MQFPAMISLAAAASLLSAPQPINSRDWFTPDDVPYATMQSGRIYLVGYGLTVSPTGVVLSCQVEVESGVREIDSRSCSRPLRRAKFKPAIGLDGMPAYGVYRTHAHWITADRPFKLPTYIVPTVELKVSRLPAGVSSPAIVRVKFAVDGSGRPSSCAEEPPHGPDPVTPQPKLASVACKEIVRTFKAAPVKDQTGKAVPSVQDAIVRFTQG